MDGADRLNTLPKFIGLSLALLGPVALAGVFSVFGLDESLLFSLAGQLLLWMLLATVLAMMLWWENRPFSAIGLERARLRSILYGLGLAIVLLVLNPVFVAWLQWLGITTSYESGMRALSKLPLWFLLVAAVTAGIVEEMLYRGYAIAVLTDLTKRRWLAALISVVVFTAAHIPSWGLGPIPIFFISSSLVTAFFIFTNDLFACMLAHVIVDAVGLTSLARAHMWV